MISIIWAVNVETSAAMVSTVAIIASDMFSCSNEFERRILPIMISIVPIIEIICAVSILGMPFWAPERSSISFCSELISMSSLVRA